MKEELRTLGLGPRTVKLTQNRNLLATLRTATRNFRIKKSQIQEMRTLHLRADKREEIPSNERIYNNTNSYDYWCYRCCINIHVEDNKTHHNITNYLAFTNNKDVKLDSIKVTWNTTCDLAG